MKNNAFREFFEKYIKGTAYKATVADRKIFLCRLTKAVRDGLGIGDKVGGAYATSRFLKHLFDKKPAEEFFFLLDSLRKIVKYPDRIYKNKEGKRGEFCFVKKIGDSEYFCSMEVVHLASVASGLSPLVAVPLGVNPESEKEEIQIATAFRLRDRDYIKNYTLLWDWGGGGPHRSALDTPEGSTNAPQ